MNIFCQISTIHVPWSVKKKVVGETKEGIMVWDPIGHAIV